MATLQPSIENDFGEYGGAELFIADIDGDGAPEIITYQGPGIFGSAILRDMPALAHVRELMPRSVSVSAFRFDGSRLWTWGEPNPPDRPYICHSAECVMACADVDADGAAEVALADGGRVVVLDGATGQEKGAAALPADNFFIIGALGEPTTAEQAALVVKNGEIGYGQWQYGEPVVGLNARLEIAWGPVAIPGGGHHILAMDLDGDGRNDYLIGYCALSPAGGILWSVDSIDYDVADTNLNHVDYTDVALDATGRRVFAIAGSDKFYAVTEHGETLWGEPGPHAQGVALGRFRPGEDLLVACYNAPDGPMTLRDLSGRELWSRTPERVWPPGAPGCCVKRRCHRNRPIVALRTAERDWIGYADGGWPWGMDGNGGVSLEFAQPGNSAQPEWDPPPHPAARGDDIGYGFAMKAAQINGSPKALIHNRRYMWVYDLQM